MEAIADRAISSYQAGFSDLGDPPPVPRAAREQDPGP
jgi:hypothetical protein